MRVYHFRAFRIRISLEMAGVRDKTIVEILQGQRKMAVENAHASEKRQRVECFRCIFGPQ